MVCSFYILYLKVKINPYIVCMLKVVCYITNIIIFYRVVDLMIKNI